MGKKKERGNGSGTVYPRKNKQGKIMGYRGSYFAPDRKRRYVSARRKGDAERALRQAMTDADRGFVFDGGTLILGDYLTRYPPKRNKSRRTVKLTPQAAEALKGHRARQNEERLQLGSLWEDRDLIFPNRRGKPMNADVLYHRGFKPLLEKAGLSGFTFHSLRHTCATLLLSKNVNSKIVSEMLGHATIAQTMDTYSHVMPGMSDVAATALEEALSYPTAAKASDRVVRGLWCVPCFTCKPQYFYGALGRTRTCGLLIRSQTLYPAELRAHRRCT